MTTEPVFSVGGEGAAATLQSLPTIPVVVLVALLGLYGVAEYLSDEEGIGIWQ